MANSIARLLTILVVAGLGSGCVSSQLHQAGESYYAAGPEQALAVLDDETIPGRDEVLASMERAVVLQELGEYEESNLLLAGAASALEGSNWGSADGGVSLLVNDAAAGYRGEEFERVYVHTLAMANSLALQDVESAARAAERALAAIDESRCDGCRFPFTRYLAAVSFEHAARPEEALTVLVEAVSESPGLPFLRSEMSRLEAAPVGAVRDLYVLLLLGRGPANVEQGVGVWPSHAVAWPRYVPRPPSPVTHARVVAAGRVAQRSVELTGMEVLAAASLRARLSGLIAKESVKTVAQEALVHNLGEDHGPGVEFLARTLLALADHTDLRHWSTLPASCQVLRVEVPPDIDAVQLVYAAPNGAAVLEERLPLPDEWSSGPLFVTRRVP